MKKLWSIWVCCLLFFAGGIPLRAQNDANHDAMLQLLRQEVNQQFDSLQNSIFPPYFLAYRVNETTDYQISASFGHIYENKTSQQVYLTIEIRVGNPMTDNFHSALQRNRELKTIPLPLDEQPELVQSILQKETQRAYNEAVKNYVSNLSTIKTQGSTSLQEYAFLRYEKDEYYEPRILDNHWHEDVLMQSLRHCTADAAMLPDMTAANAALQFRINRQYIVNSENSFVVENHTFTNLSLFVEGLTVGNTKEQVSRHFFTLLPEQLPDAEALLAEMLQMESLLYAKLEAPTMDPVSCPVWLAPQAAAVLSHHLYGHGLEDNASSFYNGKLGKSVLPIEFSVISDPTLKQQEGHYWSCSYVFDDEGVKGEKVVLIDRGDIKQRLATRTQQADAYMANGHARGRSHLPAARQSNLLVSTNKMLNINQLNDVFQSEIKNQQLEYGLLVSEAEIRCDTDNNQITIYPTVCYKVFADGREKVLVRDVKITANPQQWIDNLLVGGDHAENVAIMCHRFGEDLPTSCSSPAVLFKRMEVVPVAPASKPRMVTHLYSSSEHPDNPSALFMQVAQDEWNIDEVSLTVGEAVSPYYEDFLMTDARIFTVEASNGSVFYSQEKPVRKLVPRVLLGNDQVNNENIYGNACTPPTLYPMAEDADYSAFARDFRRATESEYLKAIPLWELKQTLMQQSEIKPLADRSQSEIAQSIQSHSFAYPTLDNLKNFACEASSSLAQNKFLNHSGINLYVLEGTVNFWNSEKTSYVKPVSIVALQIFGTVITADGKEVMDGKTIFLSNTDSLFTSQNIQKEIKEMVSYLREVKRVGKRGNHYHFGPVLVEGEAVGQLLASALLEKTPNLVANREPMIVSGTEKGSQSLENAIDQIVTSKLISVVANKSGDEWGNSVFCRQENIDAEGSEVVETDIIRKGELITLMGNRTPTKSTPYTNGCQQLAIHDEGCISTRGASRLVFICQSSISSDKLKQMLVKEAKKQGCRYAYIIRRVLDDDFLNIQPKNSGDDLELLQLYRVDVRTGKETPVVGGRMPNFCFAMLEELLCASDSRKANAVMVRTGGATGSRDFPFAGVPTCIVAPEMLLFKKLCVEE